MNSKIKGNEFGISSLVIIVIGFLIAILLYTLGFVFSLLSVIFAFIQLRKKKNQFVYGGLFFSALLIVFNIMRFKLGHMIY